MSNEQRILHISPDHLCPGGKMRKTLVSRGHLCPYCGGEGQLFREDITGQPIGSTPCPVCKGRGEMDAVITIQWQPSDEPINNNEYETSI